LRRQLVNNTRLSLALGEEGGAEALVAPGPGLKDLVGAVGAVVATDEDGELTGVILVGEGL